MIPGNAVEGELHLFIGHKVIETGVQHVGRNGFDLDYFGAFQFDRIVMHWLAIAAGVGTAKEHNRAGEALRLCEQLVQQRRRFIDQFGDT